MNIRTLAAALAASVAAFCGYATDYYVDAVNGNNANDGLAPGEGHAMESFAALFAKYTSMASGSVVHAAPGVYSNGVSSATSGSYKGGYRVIVPAGVTVVADEGPEKTIIKGAPAEGVALDASPFGCGTGAIRCVRLGDGATVKDFTLTDGHATGYGGSDYIGAVYGLSASTYVIGCIITNNVAGRAAGIHPSTAVRCFFENNRASTTGCDILGGSAFNCIFGNLLNTGSYNVYQGGPYVNNTFYGSGLCAHASKGYTILLYNSVILKEPGSNVYCTNSVFTSSKIGQYAGSTKISSAAEAKLDAKMRPRRDSPCLDAGSTFDYTNKLPSALANELSLDALNSLRVNGPSIDIGACESLFATGVPFDWHVDAVNGSDLNDGTATNAAFQNLSMALTNSYLRSGDTVHAAPGLYTNGFVTSKWRFRALVRDGVTLVGDGGAERTVIVGEPDSTVNLNASPYGCGASAVRCVRLMDGAHLRGFTLTGGHTATFTDNEVGGGFYCGDNNINAKLYATVEDCIVSNNYAAYAAGGYGAVISRCRFANNFTASRGSDVHGTRAYNCVFRDAVGLNSSPYNSFGGRLVNCTFYGAGSASWVTGSGYTTNIFNSVVLKAPGRNTRIANSCTTEQGSGYLAEGSVSLTKAEMMLDENYAPKAGSPLVDRGNAARYDIPQNGQPETFSGTDLAGGQRVYNGAIDIGAYEYDWRDDFAKALKRSQVSVVSASEGVVTNGVKALSVPSDAAIEIDWSVKADGQHTFYAVSGGAGTVSVTCDGVALVPTAEGKYAFSAVKGETRRIVVACADGASVVLRDFRDSSGFIISFR